MDFSTVTSGLQLAEYSFGIRIKNLVKKNLTDQLIFGSDTPTGDMELEMKKIESIVKDENKLNNIYSLNLMKLLNGGNSL
mgnify:CR=1 FL=1